MTAGAAALLVTAMMAVAASAAQAAGTSTGHAHRAGGNIAQVTVRPGDSLWSVAVRTAPDADARVIIQETIQLNGLPGWDVYPGEQLRVPRS